MGSRVGARAERKQGFVGGFGFGVQEHSHKGVMVLPHHNRSSSSASSFSSSPFCYCYDGGSSSSSTGGPVFCASDNQTFTPCLNNMFYHVSSSGTASYTDPFSTLSSSGETGTTSMSEKSGAFSEDQLQELERQRSIYRYMMASVPVPAELLVTDSKNPSKANSNVTAERGGSLKLGIASSTSNSMDLEPWRCRRTDGKKWRCSRSVIPSQKYCERHSHKNRPRSRKPVELPPDTANHSASTIAAAATNNADQFARTYLQNPNFYGQSETQFPVYPTLSSASASYGQNRGLRWFMKDDDASAMNSSNHGLREMVQLKVGSSQEPRRSSGNSLGLDYDLNFEQKDQLVSQSFGSLEGLVSLNQTHALDTRHFLDTLPDEAIGSSLTLSMAGAVEHSGNEEAVDPQMDTNHHWMCNEGLSWLGSPPGGPLAEALCAGVSSNASSCSFSSTTNSSCSRSSS